jgi:hypothetical protein
MAARAGAVRASLKHAAATAVGFGAALAFAKAFIPPPEASADSDRDPETISSSGDNAQDRLELVQVVFR